MSRGLIIYYSLTGHTREVAEDLALRSGWDLAEIRDDRPRQGAWGIVRSVLEAVFGQCPKIHYRGPHPRQYDLVVIATPNWCGRLASPVRTFVREYGDWFGRVGIVVTTGGLPVGSRVPGHLEDLLGWPLEAQLVVLDSEIEGEQYHDRMMALVERLDADARRKEGLASRNDDSSVVACSGIHA